jgi:hypothetical protein
MANEGKSQDAKINPGMREAKQARSAPGASAKLLGVAGQQQPRVANEAHGFDPYNTSGSFDRRKHWVRVGKR